MKNTSRSTIKDAILGSLERGWQNNRANFDPLIDKLAGALAVELEKVYAELQDRDENILSRLAAMMMPDHRFGTIPAFAIVKAESSAISMELSPETEFEYLLKDNYSNTERRFHFTPLFPINLHKARLCWLLSNNNCFEVSPSGLQPQLNEASTYIHDLVIGIESEKPLETLSSLLIYCNCSAFQHQSLLHFLEKGQAQLDGQAAKIVRGAEAYPIPPWQEVDFLDALKDAYRTNLNQHFVKVQTLDGVTPFSPRGGTNLLVLEELVETGALTEKVFAYIQSKIQGSKNSYLWVHVRLTQPIAQESLLSPNMVLSLNHFPIINRKRFEKDDYFDQKPALIYTIKPEKEFLSVHSVQEEKSGQKLSFQPLSYFNRKEEQVYNVRHQGVGRNDAYNVWERASYLLNIIKKDYRHNDLIKLLGKNLTFAELDRLINEPSEAEQEQYQRTLGQESYIYISPSKSSQERRYKISYWETDGAALPSIPAQTFLKAVKAVPGLQDGGVTLVSSLAAAQNKTDAFALELTYKQAILAKEKTLTTPFQIETYCQEFFKHQSSSVEIKRGVLAPLHHANAPCKCVEVWIQFEQTQEAFTAQAQLLEEELNRHSALSIPIVVKIMQP